MEVTAQHQRTMTCIWEMIKKGLLKGSALNPTDSKQDREPKTLERCMGPLLRSLHVEQKVSDNGKTIFTHCGSAPAAVSSALIHEVSTYHVGLGMVASFSKSTPYFSLHDKDTLVLRPAATPSQAEPQMTRGESTSDVTDEITPVNPESIIIAKSFAGVDDGTFFSQYSPLEAEDLPASAAPSIPVDVQDGYSSGEETAVNPPTNHQTCNELEEVVKEILEEIVEEAVKESESCSCEANDFGEFADRSVHTRGLLAQENENQRLREELAIKDEALSSLQTQLQDAKESSDRMLKNAYIQDQELRDTLRERDDLIDRKTKMLQKTNEVLDGYVQHSQKVENDHKRCPELIQKLNKQLVSNSKRSKDTKKSLEAANKSIEAANKSIEDGKLYVQELTTELQENVVKVEETTKLLQADNVTAEFVVSMMKNWQEKADLKAQVQSRVQEIQGLHALWQTSARIHEEMKEHMKEKLSEFTRESATVEKSLQSEVDATTIVLQQVKDDLSTLRKAYYTLRDEKNTAVADASTHASAAKCAEARLNGFVSQVQFVLTQNGVQTGKSNSLFQSADDVVRNVQQGLLTFQDEIKELKTQVHGQLIKSSPVKPQVPQIEQADCATTASSTPIEIGFGAVPSCSAFEFRGGSAPTPKVLSPQVETKSNLGEEVPEKSELHDDAIKGDKKDPVGFTFEVVASSTPFGFRAGCSSTPGTLLPQVAVENEVELGQLKEEATNDDSSKGSGESSAGTESDGTTPVTFGEMTSTSPFKFRAGSSSPPEALSPQLEMENVLQREQVKEEEGNEDGSERTSESKESIESASENVEVPQSQGSSKTSPSTSNSEMALPKTRKTRAERREAAMKAQEEAKKVRASKEEELTNKKKEQGKKIKDLLAESRVR